MLLDKILSFLYKLVLFMQNERETSPIFAHPNTHEFLVSAIEDGALGEYIEARARQVGLLG